MEQIVLLIIVIIFGILVVPFPVFIIFLVMLGLSHKFKTNLLLPPGPTGLPILGMLNKIQTKPFHLFALDLRQKYGDIFSLRLGGQLVVVLCDARLIENALAREELSAIPKTSIGRYFENYGEN